MVKAKKTRCFFCGLAAVPSAGGVEIAASGNSISVRVEACETHRLVAENYAGSLSMAISIISSVDRAGTGVMLDDEDDDRRCLAGEIMGAVKAGSAKTVAGQPFVMSDQERAVCESLEADRERGLWPDERATVDQMGDRFAGVVAVDVTEVKVDESFKGVEDAIDEANGMPFDDDDEETDGEETDGDESGN